MKLNSNFIGYKFFFSGPRLGLLRYDITQNLHFLGWKSNLTPESPKGIHT